MRNQLSTILTTLAVAAAPVLTSGVAFARDHETRERADWRVERDPSIMRNWSAGDHNRYSGDATVTIDFRTRAANPARPLPVRKVSTVASITYGANGRAIRAFTLSDGTAVVPRNQRALVRVLRPGSIVRVSGLAFPSRPHTIARANVRSLGTRAVLRSRPFAMRGVVQSVVTDGAGRADYVRLSNGRRVWIPDSMSRSLEARGGIHPGHRVVVTGHRSGSAAYVADAVTFSNGASFNAR